MTNPPRVALIGSTLYPQQYHLWEAVEQLGAELHIVGTTDRAYPPGFPWEPAPPHCGTTHLIKPIGSSRGQLWRAYPGLGRLLNKLRPDLVHVLQEPWGLTTSQVLSRRHPVISHGCETIYDQGILPERLVRRRILRRNLGKLAGFASWTQEGLNQGRTYGLPDSCPVTVVPAVLSDPRPFADAARRKAEIRKQLGIPSGQVAFGYVGRYAPEKGLDWLTTAFALSRPEGGRLYLWGAGPEEGRVRAAVDQHPDLMELRPPVPLSDVAEVMAALDVLVVPSLTTPAWTEQFGRVAVEAMLAGTPIITSNSGVLPEVVADGGVVVPELDIAGLAGAITHLAQDQGSREDLQRAALRSARERYDLEPAAARVHELWREVLKGR